MIATCVHGTGPSLGTPARAHLYSEQTAFPLTVGADYHVMGIGVWGTVLVALVIDDGRNPTWLPAGLFEIEPQRIPADWEFALLDGAAASVGEPDRGWVAMWGYPELVRDESHSDALLERDQEALDVCFRELAKRPNWKTPPQT